MSLTDDNEQEAGLGSTLGNYATSIATDFAAIPTGIAHLPQLGWSAGKALYNTYGTDKKFLDEFARQNQVEDAQQHIVDHLQTVKNTWRQEEPDLGDEELNESLDNYMKSKEFEDFTTSQLAGTAWADAAWRNTVRSFLGDKRTAEERPMGEDIAGVLATAGVGYGGGAAAKLANVASRTALTGAIFNNPVSRTALRAAELVTPLTVPYTPVNVAANASIGLALQQGERYLRGKETLFTDVPENESNISAVAATGAGLAGITGLALAMRGHNAAIIRNTVMSDTARALKEDPASDIRVPPNPKTGEAVMVAGDERNPNPPSYNESLGAATQFARWTRDNLIDESSSMVSAIRETNSRESANLVEQTYRMGSGAILSDRRRAHVQDIMHNMENVYNSAPAVEQRAFGEAINAINYKVERDSIEAATRSHIAALEKALEKPTLTSQAKSAIKRDLAEAQADLKRFVEGDVSARHALPELPPANITNRAEIALADTNPVQVALKDAFREVVQRAHAEGIKAGKLTKQESQELLARAPYWIPGRNDPLNGATGFERTLKSVLYSSKQYFRKMSEGSAKSVTQETPFGSLPNKVPNVTGRETRITAQLHPVSSLKMFVDHIVADGAQTFVRNQSLRHLAFKDGLDLPGNETDLYKNRHMELVADGRGDVWHFGTARYSKWAERMFADPRIVPEWNLGHFRFWRLGDEAWATMLRQEPQLMHGLITVPAAFSKLFKQFTTGYGNPGWAPIGAAYDLSVGMITRHHSRAFGPASAIVMKYGPKWMNIPLKFIPDPTAIVGAVYHAAKGVIDLTVTTGVRAFADRLTSMNPAMGVMRQAMGDVLFLAASRNALKAASWSHELATNRMLREGLTRGYSARVDNIQKVRDHFNVAHEKIPGPLRAAWQFYKNVVDAIYASPKRMFYTENYGILHKIHKGNIPEDVMNKLVYETHALGGDMSIRAKSIIVRDLEAMFPYATQTKLGTYHLLRQMGSPETMWYVLPRLGFMMAAYGQGIYWRTFWNEESKSELWERTPAYDRYRYIYLPTMKLAEAWFNGGNLPYSRDLYYKLPIAPDFTGILAGTAAFMQSVNLLPSGMEAKPLNAQWFGAFKDSLMPAMPPAMQALLAVNNMTLDPQTADVRGGNMIRSFGNPFRAGPQAESATPLGEISTSTSLLMKALFGTMGSHIASGLDIGLHAMKWDISATNGGITPKQAFDFNRGLSAATNEVYERIKDKAPDVPLLWTGKEKVVTMTPAWTYVGEANNDMQSIKGIRNSTMGKKAQMMQQLTSAAGGVKQKILADLTLLKIADDITKFQNPSGEYGKLKEQYNQMGAVDRSITSNYNIPREQRQQRHNQFVKAMQDNLMQRHLAINYLEQQIEAKYGQYLKPLVRGRGVTMSSLNAMMRERLGQPQSANAAAGEGDEEQ